MIFAVLVFPGSSEVECLRAVKESVGELVEYVWHTEDDLSRFDGIIIPGGAAYGDYLRPGAIRQLFPCHQGGGRSGEAGSLHPRHRATDFKFCWKAGCCPGRCFGMTR